MATVGSTAFRSVSKPLVALALVLGGLLLAPPSTAQGSARPGRPNILLLVAEDLSPRIGAFGDPVAVTPNLDRLAEQGVRFPNTFTAAGVCAPSRAALITGVHQNTLAAQHMRTLSYGRGRDLEPSSYMAVPPPEVKAFPELLRGAGYFTAAGQKLDYQFSTPFMESGPFTVWDAEGGNDVFEERPDDVPWFAMLNYGITHESGLFPVSFPRSLMHGIMLATRFGTWFPDEVVAPGDVRVPPYYPDTEIVRATIARQYANVAIMDAEVGAVLQELGASGEADDTIVIWTTDHGDGLPRAKRELYDSGLRVPMIVRWPAAWRPDGMQPGDVREELVSFVDLGPTILSLAGVAQPDWMHGRVFAGPAADAPRRYVFAARDRIDSIPDRGRAVRDRRHKYIRNFITERPGGYVLDFRENIDMMREMRALHAAGELDPVQSQWFEVPRPSEELFDVAADPDEVVNLVHDPTHAGTLGRLRAELDAWQERNPDLGAIPEAEMIENIWPGGVQPETAAPEIRFDAGHAALASATDGASIGYTIDGSGGRSDWRLYTGPFPVEPGQEVEAKAVRYGYAESEIAAAIGEPDTAAAIDEP